MRNSLFIILMSLSIFFLSCKQEKIEPEVKELNPIVEIIGIYDAKRHQSYSVGVPSSQIFDEVIEVRKNGNNYDFYVNGYWDAGLNLKRVYDGVLYCTISQHSGYWSESKSTFERKGWFSPLADYTSSEVTFQMNKNNKLEVCMMYYDIQNSTTKDPLGYDIIVYYVGNRR